MSADPIRLSLCLNLSVYYYETCNTSETKQKAIEIAMQGIELAEQDMENLDS